MSIYSLNTEGVLPLYEAESIRDIAMGVVRPVARKEVIDLTEKGEKARRFVLFADSGESIGSNAVDEFLSVSVTKDISRNWNIKISFLEYILSEEGRYSNFREVYDLQCSKQLGCIALKKDIINDVTILSSRSDLETRQVIDVVKPNRYVSVEPMNIMHCDELCNRMLDLSSRIKQESES
jgi:hypothetical protein